MSWLRRRRAVIATWGVVVAWAVFYVIAAVNADPGPSLQGAVQQLVVPPLLWVFAVRFMVLSRRSGAGSGRSTMDPPERLLAAAVAVLPERRHEWGRAVIAELAEVQGRPARWRFALSGVRAVLWLPLAGRWPVVTLVTGGWRGGYHRVRVGGRRGGARAAGVRGDLHRSGRRDGGTGRPTLAPAATAGAGRDCRCRPRPPW
jgi:hypothetical protein